MVWRIACCAPPAQWVRIKGCVSPRRLAFPARSQRSAVSASCACSHLVLSVSGLSLACLYVHGKSLVRVVCESSVRVQARFNMRTCFCFGGFSFKL